MNDLRAKVDTDRLVDEYGPAVYRLCRSLTFTREDGEDLFQETFLRALERPERLGDEPKKALFSAAVSLWRSQKRKYARRARIAPAAPLPDTAPAPDDMEAELVRREELDRVRRLAAALPERYRLPLALYYSMDMKIKDIARTLKLPEGTVKRRLHTARALVEKGLDEDD